MLLYGNVNATCNIMVCRKSSTVKTPVMAPKEQEMKQLNGKVSHHHRHIIVIICLWPSSIYNQPSNKCF